MDQFFHRVYPAQDKFHVNGSEIFNFPERLPVSADGIRYYYYKRFLDEFLEDEEPDIVKYMIDVIIMTVQNSLIGNRI